MLYLGPVYFMGTLRKLMRDSGLKKEPGCSSIEVNGIVHEFLVGDNSHKLSKEIEINWLCAKQVPSPATC